MSVCCMCMRACFGQCVDQNRKDISGRQKKKKEEESEKKRKCGVTNKKNKKIKID